MKILGFKLYGTNVQPVCRLCERYEEIDGVGKCPRKGEVSPTDKCFRFRYDPLKRVPVLANEIEQFDKSDFSLEDDDEKA